MKIEAYATPQEIKAHELLIEFVKTCRELPVNHCSELVEMQTAVHSLQQLLGMRVLRRVFPDMYPTYTKNNGGVNE